jgi:hypothetical protein
MTHLTKEARARDDLRVKHVACTYCDQPKGKRCVTKHGTEADVSHLDRVNAFKEWERNGNG